MNIINEITEKSAYNVNYEQLLYETIYCEEKGNIKGILEEISQNKNLDKKQKDSIYVSLLDYTKKISNIFEKKVEIIYRKGFKKGIISSLFIDLQTRKELEEKDFTLDETMADFSIERLKGQESLEKNLDYQKNKKEIQNFKSSLNENTLKAIEKLEDLQEAQRDLEIIDAYKNGFKDGIRL